MKLFTIVIFLVFFVSFTQAQDKWMITAQADFVFPSSKYYFYNDANNRIKDTNLDNSGFPLGSIGIQADYNYFIFKKLSLGVVGGFQTTARPSYSFFKLGGVIRYFFTDQKGGYLYLHNANNFTLNKERFKTGNNARAGLGFPVLQKEEYNLTLNLFVEQNYFKLDGSDPLLGIQDEIPRSLTVKSFGLSVGIIF
jgi:hypothetical protein